MAKHPILNQSATDYSSAVRTIMDAILRSQYQAAKLVNREILSLYYGIGRYISRNSRKGSWGTGAIRTISERLRKELPGLRGFSESSLKNMRMFYEEWSLILEANPAGENKSPIAIGDLNISLLLSLKSPVVTGDLGNFTDLSFTHHILILTGEKDIAKRWRYINLALANKWGTRRLQQEIKANAADSYGTLPTNFANTISDSRDAIKALNMFKDEYLLDFINTEELGIRDIEDIDERVIEKEIVHNVKKFIMTFGHDFAYIGNQYHLEAFSEEFFPDLLFFNRELNCLVVVELKKGAFKPSYLGQLMTYLRILDDKVKKPHENPSIGIVLCKTANKEFVEYVIQDYAKPMGVATYRLSEDMPQKLREVLPDIEDLRKLL